MDRKHCFQGGCRFSNLRHVCGDSFHALRSPGARSIQPKFQPVRPGKLFHLKRWTRFFETFPVEPNRSIEFWTKIFRKFWLNGSRPRGFRGGNENLWEIVASSPLLGPSLARSREARFACPDRRACSQAILFSMLHSSIPALGTLWLVFFDSWRQLLSFVHVETKKTQSERVKPSYTTDFDILTFFILKLAGYLADCGIYKDAYRLSSSLFPPFIARLLFLLVYTDQQQL